MGNVLTEPQSYPPGQRFGYFDRAYVINLDGDGERLAKMSGRLGRIGVPFERVAAAEARADERLFPGKPRLSPGYFACARSHLAVLRMAFQQGHERVIVLEDDVLARELKRVNEQLWEAEDSIRLCERAGDFGPRFIELARSVYHTNDPRADLKRRINALLGSRLGDVKQYLA